MNKAREYRGKRIDNGEWVYGAYSDYNWHPDEGVVKEPSIINYEDDCLWCQVIPETVGLDIGIKDRNGKSMFDGDIVEYREEYGQIEYHEDEAMYVVSFDTWFTDFDHICGIDVEVVGNVYDNPAMLGG